MRAWPLAAGDDTPRCATPGGIKRIPALACSLLAVACAAPGDHEDAQPLRPLASFPVVYTARLSTSALPDPGDAWDDGPSASEEAGRAEGERAQIDFACWVLEMEQQDAGAVLGLDEPRRKGSVVERAEVERFVGLVHEGRIPACLLSCPRLLLLEDQRGTMLTIDQRAFVAGFDVSCEPGDSEVIIADPVISTTREGLLLDVVAIRTREATGVLLDLALHFADLVEPLRDARAVLPGTSAPLTVQLPLYLTQTLRLRTTVAPDQALVLGPLPALRAGHSMLVIFTARALEPPPAAAAAAVGR